MLNYVDFVKVGRFSLFAVLVMGVLWLMQMGMSASANTDEATYKNYLPFVGNRYDSTLGPPIFGVQLYKDTQPSSKYYTDLVESGTTWIRIPVRWRSAESERSDSPKTYDWTSIDDALAGARTGSGQPNFKIIGTIYHAPDWAVPVPWHQRAVLNEDAMPDFALFVEAAAERYSGQNPNLPVVTHWEFYNEPDITTEPGGTPLWGDNGDKYAQMLEVAYTAVKAGNPNAQVLLGGIAYDAFVDQGGTFVREFLDDVLQNGGGDYFDIMNFHYYPGFSPTWTGQAWPSGGPGLLEKAQSIRHKLETEYNLYKPMMITEAGWYSDSPPNRPSNAEVQARYVVMLHTQSMAADIDVMIWWMLYDIGVGTHTTGLVTENTPPVRKPAFYVYQNMVEEMRTTHFDRKLPVSETGREQLEVYQFRDNVKQRTLYIAWLNVMNHQSTETQSLTLPLPTVTVKSMEGDVLYTRFDGDDGVFDGHVTIDVSNRPIYIEVSN